MNACEYGNVPQNRERIYIVAFRDKEDYANFSMPLSIPLKKTIRDVIDFDAVQDEKYYYSDKNCKFYDLLKTKHGWEVVTTIINGEEYMYVKIRAILFLP